MRYEECEITQIEAAIEEEVAYLEANNLPLKEGYIGVESLSGEEGYAYAAKGGYGNMGVYLPLREAMNIVTAHKMNKKAIR